MFCNSLIFHCIVFLKATLCSRAKRGKLIVRSAFQSVWRINNAKKAKNIYYSGLQIVLEVLFWIHLFHSLHPYSPSLSNTISLRLSFYLFALPERQIYGARAFLSEAVLSPVSTLQREKFLSICWIQVWWCALVAHLRLHLLTWHSCD